MTRLITITILLIATIFIIVFFIVQIIGIKRNVERLVQQNLESRQVSYEIEEDIHLNTTKNDSLLMVLEKCEGSVNTIPIE